MKRHRHPLPKPTLAQELRWERIRALGCIPCRLLGYAACCEIHHLNEGGKHGGRRRGHDETVGLCPWHHRGDPGATTKRHMRELRGPSWADGTKVWRPWLATIGVGDGSDDALLDYQNLLIAEHYPCGT